ncbi:MAG: diaminopimelate epimerase [Candidatus Marinimicrobia bacterium]|nr:diaminopimelate epimerase [Candidatus Neomarinimicrobiota bacterium]MCF7905456.1 diaminopimelate epimerase [Candidatus Neomarinimicrobiota bacterium]
MIKFDKYVAAGNDFIIFDNWDGRIDLAEKKIVEFCDRRFGIGADGVLLLSPSEDSEFRMNYFNADGSRGEMCGNGARALVKFAHSLEKIRSKGVFRADDGLHHFKVNDDQIFVEIKVTDELHDWTVPRAGCGFINTGVPHLIVPVPDADAEALIDLGEQMNAHKRHPAGTNTNIVSKSKDGLVVRTWERGVNTETLACGTGATAVAIYAHQTWGFKWPINLRFRGGILKVDFYDNRYWLTGSTALVFSGLIA